jgi:hypothetical protein
MDYVVTVYYRDPGTVLHSYANLSIAADSPADAKYRAMLAVLADARAASLSRSWKAEIFPDMQKARP